MPIYSIGTLENITSFLSTGKRMLLSSICKKDTLDGTSVRFTFTKRRQGTCGILGIMSELRFS